jgi:hypothetical protein
MTVHKYKARPCSITALQYRRGITTEAELLAFCPGLVISGGEAPAIVALQSPAGMTSLADGDYLVKRNDIFYRWDPDEFENEYEEAS